MLGSFCSLRRAQFSPLHPRSLCSPAIPEAGPSSSEPCCTPPAPAAPAASIRRLRGSPTYCQLSSFLLALHRVTQPSVEMACRSSSWLPVRRQQTCDMGLQNLLLCGGVYSYSALPSSVGRWGDGERFSSRCVRDVLARHRLAPRVQPQAPTALPGSHCAAHAPTRLPVHTSRMYMRPS